MKIYRLEKNGLGPFATSEESLDRLMHCAKEMALNAWPRKPFAPKDCFYACESVMSLKRWFSSFTLASFLTNHGFAVHVYEIDSAHVDIGTEQVTAKLSEAVLVERITDPDRLEELYKAAGIVPLPEPDWRAIFNLD